MAKSISDGVIKRRNYAIISSLKNSDSIIEIAKSWEVGALLSIFDADSKAETEQALLKNIIGIQKKTTAS